MSTCGIVLRGASRTCAHACARARGRARVRARVRARARARSCSTDICACADEFAVNCNARPPHHPVCGEESAAALREANPANGIQVPAIAADFEAAACVNHALQARAGLNIVGGVDRGGW